LTPPTTDLPAGDAGRIELRATTDADRPFLLAVYASTRAEELAVLPWTDEQRDAFLRMQFEAQDNWYRQVYPDAEFLIVVRDDAPIGRLYVARGEHEIRVVDIALLPAYRGQGIGSRLLGDVLAAADRDRLQVTVHVEPWNPAKRLYERLGFETCEQGQVYDSMVRPARQLNTAS
jgi:ribosomal protein S18 acetylase RimI-like enzyme